MDCVFAMHVATVFETYWTIVEYQKAENQSLEQRERERKCQFLKMNFPFPEWYVLIHWRVPIFQFRTCDLTDEERTSMVCW